jgi:hypothetical protein
VATNNRGPIHIEETGKDQERTEKKTGWAKGSILSVWAGCSVTYCGAFQLGELFAKQEVRIDQIWDLLWEDVKFCQNTESAILKIKSSKWPGPPEAVFTNAKSRIINPRLY